MESTITVMLPADLTRELETQRISREQLELFLVAATEAWLTRRALVRSSGHPDVSTLSWNECFRESAIAFVDQLIDQNRPLFEELARL